MIKRLTRIREEKTVKTFSPTTESVVRNWYVIDLKDKTLGRAATEIAKILSGKHKPIFSPHIDTGDFVIVLNAGKFNVTGRKMLQKLFIHHSGYPGGYKEENLTELMARFPDRPIRMAVNGMLAKNKLRAPRMKRLKVYLGEDHPHKAQGPVVYNLE
jgi:large subunit ribosomal protein L13